MHGCLTKGSRKREIQREREEGRERKSERKSMATCLHLPVMHFSTDQRKEAKETVGFKMVLGLFQPVCVFIVKNHCVLVMAYGAYFGD